MASCSRAASTTASTSVSAGKRSFFTRPELSVIAVEARTTPSFRAIHGSRPLNRKRAKLPVRTPAGEIFITVEKTKVKRKSIQSGWMNDQTKPSSEPA